MLAWQSQGLGYDRESGWLPSSAGQDSWARTGQGIERPRSWRHTLHTMKSLGTMAGWMSERHGSKDISLRAVMGSDLWGPVDELLHGQNLMTGNSSNSGSGDSPKEEGRWPPTPPRPPGHGMIFDSFHEAYLHSHPFQTLYSPKKCRNASCLSQWKEEEKCTVLWIHKH